MVKVIKTVALTHTPTTHIICIPADIVKELGLDKENRLIVQLDDDNKIVITKTEQK